MTDPYLNALNNALNPYLNQGASNGPYWQAAAQAQNYPGGITHLSSGTSISLAAQQAQLQAIYQAYITEHSKPSEPLENAGISVGEIIAWRCWRIDSGFLRSAAMETVWGPGEPMDGIVTDCGTGGVHAWKTKGDALTYGLNGMAMAYGKVALWGDVIEHEDGYRAEFAKILSIDGILHGNRGDLAALRHRYGVGGIETEPPLEPKRPWWHSEFAVLSGFALLIVGALPLLVRWLPE